MINLKSKQIHHKLDKSVILFTVNSKIRKLDDDVKIISGMEHWTNVCSRECMNQKNMPKIVHDKLMFVK